MDGCRLLCDHGPVVVVMCIVGRRALRVQWHRIEGEVSYPLARSREGCGK